VSLESPRASPDVLTFRPYFEGAVSSRDRPIQPDLVDPELQAGSSQPGGWPPTAPVEVQVHLVQPLVGVTAHPISCGADKEVEVGACVGLLYVVDVEPFPAAYWLGEAFECGGVGLAAAQFVLRHL
jgi:hypothetical protein